MLRREQEPWEASDGAVYLLREVIKSGAMEAQNLLRFMEPLAELARMRHFGASSTLQQTIWNCLPSIGQGLGLRAFKRQLLDFIDPLFAALGSDQTLVSAAAGRCVGALRDWMGPGIWAARLEPRQLALQQASPDVPPPAGKFSIAGKVGGPGAPGTVRAPFINPVNGAGVGPTTRPQPQLQAAPLTAVTGLHAVPGTLTGQALDSLWL